MKTIGLIIHTAEFSTESIILHIIQLFVVLSALQFANTYYYSIHAYKTKVVNIYFFDVFYLNEDR